MQGGPSTSNVTGLSASSLNDSHHPLSVTEADDDDDDGACDPSEVM